MGLRLIQMVMTRFRILEGMAGMRGTIQPAMVEVGMALTELTEQTEEMADEGGVQALEVEAEMVQE